MGSGHTTILGDVQYNEYITIISYTINIRILMTTGTLVLLLLSVVQMSNDIVKPISNKYLWQKNTNIWYPLLIGTIINILPLNHWEPPTTLPCSFFLYKVILPTPCCDVSSIILLYVLTIVRFIPKIGIICIGPCF